MNNKFFKLISLILVFIFIIQCIFPIHVSIAGNIKKPKEPETYKTSDSFFDNLLFDGTVKSKQDSRASIPSAGEGLLMIIPNTIVSILKFFMRILGLTLDTFVPTRITAYPGSEINDYINDDYYKRKFTLDKLFFGDIELLDANFFNIKEDGTDLNTNVKKNVAQWYLMMAMIAIIMLLGILIYLALNMVLVYAGVRTPQKHANIKQTMINLLISLAMIFLLPVILVIIANLNDALIKLFNNIRVSLINGLAEKNFEIHLRGINYVLPGLNNTVQGITFILLIIIYMRFIIVYLKRFYTLGFLTIIAPLITVTYALDKLKDDKSQVLGKFYREYFYAYFIQTLHAFMFILYLGGLGAIASTSPIFGLAFLAMFGRVEKIIKGVFDSRDLIAIRSSAEVLKPGK